MRYKEHFILSGLFDEVNVYHATPSEICDFRDTRLSQSPGCY